ncbi:MAG: hypothetical protein ACPGN3_09665 [Opitutales bacterium]
MLTRYLPIIAFVYATFVAVSFSYAGSSVISIDDIRKELRPYGLHQIEFTSTEYYVPSYRWTYREFMPFYKDYLRTSRARYQDEGVDCDNFCIFFQSALFQRKVQLGHEYAGNSAAGIMYCDVGPRQSIRHVIIIIRTDKGWFAVEAENGKVMTLKKYLRFNKPIRAIF